MGITGTKKPSEKVVEKSVNSIRRLTKLPTLVGFGINSYSQVSKISKFSDGCVVGSAIVKIIEDSYSRKESDKTILKNIHNFLIKLKKMIF